MLPRLYGPETGKQLLENYREAPIPELHKVVFGWIERFTRRSWDIRAQDIRELRAYGLSDADIVNGAQIACLQTWWTMSADGGGIPLEGNAITGPVLQKSRAFYKSAPGGLTGAEPGRPRVDSIAAAEGPAWVTGDESTETYLAAAAWAEARYGFVPNLFKAVSLRPEFLRRHILALELLEMPQTATLTPRQHAMVRALASSLTHCTYSAETIRQLVESVSGERGLYQQVTSDYRQGDWAPADRTILDFTAKLVRNAYKVTEQDALRFREVGLDDEAYVDVLNTAAIQTSFDRLANSLGIRPDPHPMLPWEKRVEERARLLMEIQMKAYVFDA